MGIPKSKLPAKLVPGSTVALVAPAFGFDTKAFEEGRQALEHRFQVRTQARADVTSTQSYFAGSDERRLEELFQFLVSTEVDAIAAIRGGYGCSRIAPDLLKKLRAHVKKTKKPLKPKIFLGYSDLTIFLNALHQEFGWPTLHGPVLSGRAVRTPNDQEAQSLKHALTNPKPLGSVRYEKMHTFHAGKAKAPIVGGCLSLITAAIGTEYEVQTKGKILFLEDTDERPYRIDRMLTQCLHAGLLDGVKGILFGELAACGPATPERDPSQTTAHSAIAQALAPLLLRKKIPVVFDFPAGHGPMQTIVPIGTMVSIEAKAGAMPKITFLEAAVK